MLSRYDRDLSTAVPAASLEGSLKARSLFAVSRDSPETGVSLLFLRVSFCLSLFLKHGVEKITGFSRMLQGFPDPLHMGAHLSLSIATTSDVIAAVFVIVGFATRPSAFFAACNILVTWILVHHGMFFGEAADHGEVCVLYICGFLAILLCGPGRYSSDALLAQSSVPDRRLSPWYSSAGGDD